jgi:hypothetical protein
MERRACGLDADGLADDMASFQLGLNVHMGSSSLRLAIGHF